MIVQQLRKVLPPGYVAELRVHSGSQIEIDIAKFLTEDPRAHLRTPNSQLGLARSIWTPVPPSFAVKTDLLHYDEYEVRIFDVKRGRQLVAAIEIVSPANKDRQEHRNIFAAKCAALLQKGVAVSIVDLVTVRNFNLYSELMNLIGHPDLVFDSSSISLYAASFRWTTNASRKILEVRRHELSIGQTCPTLPLWLNQALVVPLDLEASYEQASADLWIA